jgi:tetratricopeptide (TPR) repeat protein
VTQGLFERANLLVQARRYEEALPLLQRVMTQRPAYWGAWYLAGQCCRFREDIDGAIKYLSRAAELNPNDPPIFLALGIAFQLDKQWKEAVATLLRAIEIDPDYAVAYNSLALTQQECGELDKALHNYDAGALALARRIVKGMRNNLANLILKNCEENESPLWMKYALYAAQYRCALDNQSGMAWPTSEQAEEEERTQKHTGLYWEDAPVANGEIYRMFLPNYFNTFKNLLGGSEAYSKLIENRGVVLEQLGQLDEARQHFEEADEF